MKRFLKAILAAATVLALMLTASCGDDFDYTMKEYTTGALSYELPTHYESAEHVEAHAYYITLNSAVTVYSYTHGEFANTYAYGGDFTALSTAQHIVDRNGYECNVGEGALANSAVFSFLFSNGEATAYYINLTLANDEYVCMISFSCPSEKLDSYQPLIDDILNSAKLASQ